jgi:hypothetical protein
MVFEALSYLTPAVACFMSLLHDFCLIVPSVCSISVRMVSDFYIYGAPFVLVRMTGFSALLP